MAKANKAPSAAALPSAVPGAPSKPAAKKPDARTAQTPAAALERGRKKKLVDRHVPMANTIQSDPATILEGIKAEYDWEDPSLETEVAEGSDTVSHPSVSHETQQIQTPTAPAKPVHSASTLYLAKELGLSQEKIDKYNPAQLDDFVTELAAHRAELRRDAATVEATRQQRPPASAAAPATSAPSSTAEPPADALSWGVDEDGKPIAEDSVHPAIVHVIKDLHKQIKELKEGYSTLMRGEMIRGAETQAQKLDSLFAAHPDLFGTDAGSKLPMDSPKKQKMLAVLGVMKSLAGGDLEQRHAEAMKIMYDRDSAPIAPATGTAATIAAPAQTQTPPKDPKTGRFVPPKEGEPIHNTVEEWENGATHEPTNRISREKIEPKKKAIDNVAKLMRDNPDILGGDTDYSNDFIGSSNGAM